MKFNCKFYLEGEDKNSMSPIYMRLTYNSERIRYYTGYRISSKKWINTKMDTGDGTFEVVQKVAKGSAGFHGTRKVRYSEINNVLAKIYDSIKKMLLNVQETPTGLEVRSMLDELLQKNTDNKEVEQKKITKNKVSTAINVNESKEKCEEIKPDQDFWLCYERYVKNVNVSPKRRKQHQSAFNLLKQYEVSEGLSFSFDSFVFETIRGYENWLLTTLTRKKTYRGQNYVSGLLKKLCAFFNWIIKYYRTNRIPFIFHNPLTDYEIRPEIYGDPFYLSKEERDYLYSFTFKDTDHEVQRDIFIFQCLCGARVGDMMKFTSDNICGDELIYIPSKTKESTHVTVRVPLNEIALALVRKYENNGTGFLFPFISDAKYNKVIKAFFRLAGLNRIVTRLNSVTRLPEQKRLYEIASSHMARRTFVGVLYKNEVKDQVISSMIGQSPNSRSYIRYRTIDKEIKVRAIQSFL